MSLVIIGEGLSALSVYHQLSQTGYNPELIGPRLSKKISHIKFKKPWEHVFSLYGRANVWGGWLDFCPNDLKDERVKKEVSLLTKLFEPKIKNILPHLKKEGFKPKLEATRKDFKIKPKSLGNYFVKEIIFDKNKVSAIRAIHAKSKKEKIIKVDHLIMCASPFNNMKILSNSKFVNEGFGEKIGNHLITAGVMLFEKKPCDKKIDVFKNYPNFVLEFLGPKRLPKSFNEKKYKYYLQWAMIYNLKNHKTSKMKFKPTLEPVFKLTQIEKSRYLKTNKFVLNYLQILFPESKTIKLSIDFNISVAAHEYGGLIKMVNSHGQFNKIKNLFCYDTSILDTAFSTFPTLGSLGVCRVKLKDAINKKCFKA